MILRNFGADQTVAGLNRMFIRRRGDGSCGFLGHLHGSYWCALQRAKPRACQIWPFKVFSEPKYGYAEQAAHNFQGGKIFVYVDSTCNGLSYGDPSQDFINTVLQEFVEIALGVRSQQYRSTSTFNVSQF